MKDKEEIFKELSEEKKNLIHCKSLYLFLQKSNQTFTEENSHLTDKLTAFV
jgi:hypothetical protein